MQVFVSATGLLGVANIYLPFENLQDRNTDRGSRLSLLDCSFSCILILLSSRKWTVAFRHLARSGGIPAEPESVATVVGLVSLPNQVAGELERQRDRRELVAYLLGTLLPNISNLARIWPPYIMLSLDPPLSYAYTLP